LQSLSIVVLLTHQRRDQWQLYLWYVVYISAYFELSEQFFL